MHTRVSSAIVFVLVMTFISLPAEAQYFGRNKVQYRDFDFQILHTDHFDIYYYPSEREGIDIAARMAERWHARLERIFNHQLRGRQPLVLYASHVDFEQTNIIGGELGEGTGGVTEPLRRRIVLPMGGPLADTDHVIGHELVHAFQFDITTSPGMAPGQTGAQRLPLWFIEGMAEYLSLGPVDPNTAMWLRDAARKEELPSIDDLNNPKYFPYRWGQAFWAYVAGRWGDAVIGRMLVSGAATGDYDAAIERQLGIKTKELSDAWHQSIRDTYGPVLARTAQPSESGTLAISDKRLGGDLNVGPAISPDGRWIAYLSEKSLFSIDLFVADLQSGRTVHKLTSTGSDPHYSSLQFIYSAGGWDAESRRLAIASVVDGKPALAIFDAQSGDREREIQIADVDEVFNPTWSPDGNSICFTGMSRGLTDLYVVDVQSGSVRALTKDPFADLTPSWSPDGRRIAFATDRFTSRLGTLDIGRYGLAVIDPQSAQIERVETPSIANNINPQWGPDSRTLYFISDVNGIANLYSVNADGGAIAALTNVSTGLTGITASSPALSVASRAGVAAFSVYDDGKYNVYTRPLGGGTPATATEAERTRAATLPPLERRASDVQRLLADAQTGLPSAAAAAGYESTPFKSRLQLEALGQPTVAVGVDRFGAGIGGGISAYFSDMLGNHSLVTGLQLNSGLTSNFSLKDTAVQAAYFNQQHRWNWGMVGGQIPYLSGGIQEFFGDVSGEPSLIQQTILFRQTERSAAGVVAYPFNRAQRLEFQAGASQISFDQIIQTQAFSLNTGGLILDDTQEQSLGNSLTLGTASAALVYDTANFGATSPVQGQRYRVEATPTFGSITTTSFLADYRRYFMPWSLYTLAVRGLHYGRYGSGGEDSRLFPLSIGYPTLVRGYDVNSISIDECVPDETSDCPAFDRLIGSRMLVGNLEFRFPLLRPFTSSPAASYGPVPVEVALFADGGVAWSRGQKPSLFGGDRKGVASAGVTLRTNLFGFAVAQFDFARPFDRPGQGWVFQFNLAPGF
jgi:WD40 repeat protein